MREPFLLPPLLQTESGTVRRVGFEFEYTGVGLERSARIVRELYGGRIERDSTFVQRVRDTAYGDFTVEIDTSFLKEKRYEAQLAALGMSSGTFGGEAFEASLMNVFSNIVPFEISTPPLPMNDLGKVDELRDALREQGAKGTTASLLYAFGMHINPELPSRDFSVIASYLKSYVLLYPWIADRVRVDITRRFSPYVQPFPDEYLGVLLSPKYPRTVEQFIEDYLRFNPTRNRGLDMLPVLALLDESTVMNGIEQKKLVKPRGAFHYRLPNCLIDEPEWTIAREWNIWVEVEKLANDEARLATLCAAYHEAKASRGLFGDEWQGVVAAKMRTAA